MCFCRTCKDVDTAKTWKHVPTHQACMPLKWTSDISFCMCLFHNTPCSTPRRGFKSLGLRTFEIQRPSGAHTNDFRIMYLRIDCVTCSWPAKTAHTGVTLHFFFHFSTSSDWVILHVSFAGTCKRQNRNNQLLQIGLVAFADYLFFSQEFFAPSYHRKERSFSL